MAVLAPPQISLPRGQAGTAAQRSCGKFKRSHHDGAVLADSPGTCCPPRLTSNAEHKSTEKGQYQIYLFTFPDWVHCLGSRRSATLSRTSLLGIRVREVKGKGLAEDYTPAVLPPNCPEGFTHTRVKSRAVLTFYSRLQSAFKQHLVIRVGGKRCTF